MTALRQFMVFLLVAMPLGFGMTQIGCVPPPPEPPASAVLEGDWVTTDVEGADAFLRFDADGVVVRAFAITDEGVTINVDITGATTTLVGSDVTLTIPINDAVVTFEGTLSADENTLTGTSTREITIGEDITVTIPQGEITFTRIECLADDDCEADEACVDYFCVAGPECTTDDDCEEGEVCDDGVCVEELPPGPAETFPNSLHDANFRGMDTFYSAANGGFETLTGVPYDDLTCKDCHDASRFENADPPVAWPGTDSCENCHVDPADPSQPVTEDICLGCHGRQAAERNFFTDVHRDAGFTCMNCHTASEMHGDGNIYESLLVSPGPVCEDCHNEDSGTLPSNTAHVLHGATVDCSACHVQSVISCYNCHFDSEVAGAGKRFFAPPRQNFKLLVQRDGKVHAGNLMSLVYEQQTFYVIAPYYAHSVIDSPQCDDCHASAAMVEYADTGQITVALWNEDTRTLDGPTGVIPIPPDWNTALQLDFLDYTGDPTTPIPDTDPDLWQFLKTGADLTQMLFAEPLTADQIDALTP